jgi:uncharacterized protein YdaU (DUF1376 family)
MNGLPWYAHSIAAYEKHTAHLTMLQHGAYRLLMDHYYKMAAPLPAPLMQLHRICRAVADEEKAAVSAVLSEFFTLEDDGWHNDRADEELARMALISDKRRKAANSRHSGPEKTHAKASANAGAIAKQVDLQKHPTLNTKQSSLREDIGPLPDWLPKEAWAGFLEMRRRIRAPMTPRAMTLAIRQLEDLRQRGHDPTVILDQSTQNSWKGLFEPKGNGNGKRTANDKFLAAAHAVVGDYLGRAEGGDDSGFADETGRPLLPS